MNGQHHALGSFGEIALSLAAMLVAGHATAAIDQSFIDQDWEFQANVGAGSTVDWAQTFTVGQDGILSGFDVWVIRNTNVTLPLLFDIRSTGGGVPVPQDSGIAIKASGEIAADTIPPISSTPPRVPFVLTHVELGDSSFAVTAGQQYAIVLQSNDPGGQFNGVTYSWQGLLRACFEIA
jgi:hypothetical protein